MTKVKRDALSLNNDVNSTIVILSIVIGVIARYLVMSLGYNYDFDSYKIVGEIVSRGGNVYAETSRYNYGFIFSLIQGLGYKATSLIDLGKVDFIFRVYIVSVLTLADVGIACWIRKNFNLNLSLLFFLNPVSIIITGYHNQFDNIAVLLALLATSFVDEESSNLTKKDFVSIILLSLSLMTKHILFIFFGWIFLQKNKGQSIIKRLAYTFIPPAIFLLSFIPFCIGNTAALEGIVNNVFRYRSYNNFPLLRVILKIIPIPNSMYFYIYVAIMIVVGLLLRKKRFSDMMILYFASMVAFSSAIANQYLIIPVIALVVYRNKIYFWLYEIFGFIYCILNGNELHFAGRIQAHYPSSERVLSILSGEGGVMVMLMAFVLAVMIILEIYE